MLEVLSFLDKRQQPFFLSTAEIASDLRPELLVRPFARPNRGEGVPIGPIYLWERLYSCLARSNTLASSDGSVGVTGTLWQYKMRTLINQREIDFLVNR